MYVHFFCTLNNLRIKISANAIFDIYVQVKFSI